MAADNVLIRREEEPFHLRSAFSGEWTHAEFALLAGAAAMLAWSLAQVRDRFARFAPAPLLAIFLTGLFGSYYETDCPQPKKSALTAAGQCDAESKAEIVLPLATISFRPCLERAVTFAPWIAGARVVATPRRAKALLLRGPPAA